MQSYPPRITPKNDLYNICILTPNTPSGSSTAKTMHQNMTPQRSTDTQALQGNTALSLPSPTPIMFMASLSIRGRPTLSPLSALNIPSQRFLHVKTNTSQDILIEINTGAAAADSFYSVYYGISWG
ncbi:hypothetical protein QCA50_011925 [Cerrena zonata]|uniref:Uncharacterized protein n=1 Tax=Cerrena zonata TaxID=2478898 RepID=A0AAW0FTY5_9APHY